MIAAILICLLIYVIFFGGLWLLTFDPLAMRIDDDDYPDEDACSSDEEDE